MTEAHAEAPESEGPAAGPEGDAGEVRTLDYGLLHHRMGDIVCIGQGIGRPWDLGPGPDLSLAQRSPH